MMTTCCGCGDTRTTINGIRTSSTKRWRWRDIPSDAVTNDTNSNKSSSTSSSDEKVAGRSTLQTRSDDELRRIRIERQRERDPISYAIGEFGRWQFQWTVLLALFNLPCTWHIFVMTFQNDAGGPFWCARPDNLKNLSISEWVNISGITERSSSNDDYRYNPCFIKDLDYDSLPSNWPAEQQNRQHNTKETTKSRKCTSWEFEAENVNAANTIVSEWSLVCDREQIRHVAEMMFLIGVAFGGFFSGLVSDRFGRKKTLMTSLVLQIILGVLLAITPSFELFLILRAILGFVCVSIVFSGLILCLELVGGKWLTISGVSYMFPVPLSYILVAGIAYITPRWRSLQLAITLPSVLFLALWWILPESPRWLLTMGKIDRVMEILKEAARVNKRSLPSNLEKILKQNISRIEQTSSTDKRKARVSDLFATPTIRLISCVLYIVWFGVYLVYYGLVLNLSNIGGDVYVNSIISGIVEIPAIALSIIILLRMGRRKPLCLTLICSGIACLLTVIIPTIIGRNAGQSRNSATDDGNVWQTLTISFAMIGKFTISSSNVIIPVYTAELFPTVIRNLGVGSSNVPAGIALMIVPYLWNIAAMNQYLPMTVLGLTGVISGISVLLLPETAEQGLTDTFGNDGVDDDDNEDLKDQEEDTRHAILTIVEKSESKKRNAC